MNDYRFSLTALRWVCEETAYDVCPATNVVRKVTAYYLDRNVHFLVNGVIDDLRELSCE